MKTKNILKALAVVTMAMPIFGCDVYTSYANYYFQDLYAESYIDTDSFDSKNQLTVFGVKKNGEKVELDPFKYTYNVFNSSKDEIDTTKPFGQPGEYTLEIYIKDIVKSAVFNVKSSYIDVDYVEFSETVEQIRIRKTAQFKANVFPLNATDPGIIYSSSDETIATVDSNGVVKGLSDGVVDIIATSVANPNKTVSAKLVVRDIGLMTYTFVDNTFACENNEWTPSHYNCSYSNKYGVGLSRYSTVKLNSKTSFEEVGYVTIYFACDNANDVSSAQVTIGNTKLGSVQMSSSEPKTIQSVTCLADSTLSGKVLISFRSGAGFVYINKICVHQEVEPIFAEGIEIVSHTVIDHKLPIGESSVYSVNLTPYNCNQKIVTWNSSNPGVATIDSSGVLHGLSVGNTTITASVLQEEGFLSTTYDVEVYIVDVEEIIVSGKKNILSITRTLQLNYSLIPNNATYKNVTWTSSNNAIATVDQSGLVKGVGIGDVTITALSEDGVHFGTFDISVQDLMLDDHTILIYMCGADLESDNYLATSDLSEILSRNCPESVHICVQTGGAKRWSSKYNISSKNLTRYHVEGKTLSLKESLSNNSMGASSTLQSFVEWGLKEYPSENTGLVLWNHGGAMSGVCYDENYGDDSLTAAEVSKAVTNARKSLGMSEKLTWIGYDACLMSVTDIASVNSLNFEYMVASEESETGYGWDYDNFLPTLYENPVVNPEVFLSKICSTFISSTGGASSSNDQTLACIDLNKIGNYINEFESWARGLNITDKSGFNALKSAESSCLRFGYVSGGYRYNIYDAGDFLIKASEFNSNIQPCRNALESMIVYNGHGGYYRNTKPSGICTFMSANGYTYKSEYTENDTLFSYWRELNLLYGSW